MWQVFGGDQQLDPARKSGVVQIANAQHAACDSKIVSAKPRLKARSNLRTVSGSEVAISFVTISAMPYSSGTWSWYSM